MSRPELDFLAIELCHGRRGVAERTAAEGAEHRIADLVRDQRIELRGNMPLRFQGAEHAAVAEVLRRRAQFEEGKHISIIQPSVSKIRLSSVFWTSNTDARIRDVDVDRAVLGGKQINHLVVIRPAILRQLFCAYCKMAVRPPEHVFLLSDRSFAVRTAGIVRVRHVQNGETLTRLTSQRGGDFTPITAEYRNKWELR